MTRILGIDPGSRVTGYGLIDSDGRHSRHLASGVIKTEGHDFPARLGVIFRGVAELIGEHQPAVFAIEQVFLAKNAQSALKLGQARGAAICAAVNAKLPVFEYSPREVKQAVVGTGGADKAQMQFMIRMLLNLNDSPSEDQADALGVAICHGHVGATKQRLGALT